MQFSVVIPLFNKAPYINRALDSVLAQTTQDFEIIVVDDGSTDGGGEIVKNYFDKRIRLIHQANKGVSEARNAGIKAARAGLVAFLDADDEWDINFLSTVIELQREYPSCGVYATSYRYLYPNGKTELIRNRYLPDQKIFIIPDLFVTYIDAPIFCASSIAVSKKVFDAIGGFPSNVALGEDIEMWLTISLHFPIVYCNIDSASYRRNTGSNTCDTIPQNEQLHFVNYFESMLTKHEIPEKYIKSLSQLLMKFSLRYAKNLIKTGYKEKARQTLATIKPNSTFWVRWFGLYLISFFPITWISFILKKI